MKITDIENLSAAELKAQRAEVMQAIADAEPGDVMERYFQARLDAKQRDEKLAEQGKTITLLQEAGDSFKEAALESDKALSDAANELNRLGTEIAKLNKLVELERQAKIDAEQRALRMKDEALSAKQAVNSCVKILTDEQAKRAIEDADKA